MRENSLTEGKILPSLLLFSLPLIVGNFFQTFYNIADSIIVGRFIGPEALAAVGSAYSLMTFLTSLMIGLCMGAGIAFSYAYGAKDFEKLKSSLGLSFLLIAIITFVVFAFSFLLLDVILRLLRVPPDVYVSMRDYMKVILLGLPGVFLYNFEAQGMRGIGNSRTPLFYMIFSAALNIVLDLLFVLVIPMGVVGAALATIISQYVSGIGLFIHGFVFYPVLRFSRRHMRFEKKLFKELSSLSIFTSMQQSVMNFGILMVQGVVNSFGSSVMAAFSSGVKIDSLCYLPLQDFGNATSVFIAQNMGAKKKERAGKGVRLAFISVSLFSILMSFFIVAFSHELIGLFTTDENVIRIGMRYLLLEGSFYILIGYLFLFYGYFRARKRAGVSLFLTVVSLGLRVLLAYVLSAVPALSENGIWMSIPIGWALADLSGLLLMRREKIKNIP